MISPERGSRMRASPALRGAGILTPSAVSAAPAREPEIRMTAIATGGPAGGKGEDGGLVRHCDAPKRHNTDAVKGRVGDDLAVDSVATRDQIGGRC